VEAISPEMWPLPLQRCLRWWAGKLWSEGDRFPLLLRILGRTLPHGSGPVSGCPNVAVLKTLLQKQGVLGSPKLKKV